MASLISSFEYGIDEQRVLQLQRCARETRKDEDSRIFRILRRHIFLCDQVHPVAERRDERDFGCTVEARQVSPVIALVDVADRHPIHFGEFAVDAAR
jgi:hypothetical protein